MILESFAGPGGWSTGARLAGYRGPLVGVELDMAACRTGHAAGHARVRADAATFPLAHLRGRVVGHVGSPPCPTFSAAGLGAGRVDLANVLRLIDDFADGRGDPGRYDWADARSALTAQPMRWVAALEPVWLALEQVPPVLPIWRHLAERLRARGYWTWCGVLSAEEYGVPQTRRRAILMASLAGPVAPPTPTHRAYRAGSAHDGQPDLFGSVLPAPVSMAQALGRAGEANATERDGDEPAPTILSLRSGNLVLRNGTQSNACTREIDEPAGALFFGARGNAVDWVMRSNYGTSGDPADRGERGADEPAATVTGKANRNLWVSEPGHKGRESGEAQFERDAVRVTVAEAAVLQSFPPDYPWQGTKSQQFRQVGDAVPPLLAAAVLRPLLAVSGQLDDSVSA